MSSVKPPSTAPARHVPQRRVNANVDHLRPHRWNWSFIARPLDERIVRQTDNTLQPEQVFSLRYFWLDGLLSAVSENFYLGYIVLFALAYGANNGQVGWLTAVANLLGALALFPGARLVERTGQRKRLVVFSGGVLARVQLLMLALLPLVVDRPLLAIGAIIAFNGARTFAANFSNPAWTALVADLVPESVRGRYFSGRNMIMGVAALAVAPLAGQIIRWGNDVLESPTAGYQLVFLLAFAFGVAGTLSFRRIREPQAVTVAAESGVGSLRDALRRHPAFVGLVLGAFVFNLSLQVAAPFFNVYLVTAFGASTTTIGLLASVSSATALVGQQVFGRSLDRRGAIWVMLVTGFIIPLLPLGWVFITAPWQVALINTLGGFVWAGYNLANFNLLLSMTPDSQRPRTVALYQTAVFVSAVVGPILGGYLADAVGFKLIFGLSSAGRFAGTLIFLWLAVRRPAAMDTSGIPP